MIGFAICLAYAMLARDEGVFRCTIIIKKIATLCREVQVSHRAELMLYEAAAKYLTAHLNGRDKIPLGEWRSEQARLTAERDGLYQAYYRLKEEVKEVEVIRRSVESAARDDRIIDTRDKGAEL